MNMIPQVVRWPLLVASSLGLLMLPGALRLPEYRRTRVDGVETLHAAVNKCRDSGVEGWELVTFAQNLVCRKFATYSTLNLWDPPNRAFIYGTGYCTQYNLALKHLLDHLGFKTHAVFCLRVRVTNNPDWTMGHTWLRVTIDGETRDVCAGDAANLPGQVNFVPLQRIYRGYPPLLFFTHIGMIFFMGVLGWPALLSGRPLPGWTFEKRP